MGFRRLVGLGCALALVALPTAALGRTAPLDQRGRWFVDPQGRVVILHGVNMVYKGWPYYPAAGGFGDDDAAFLAQHDLKTVRVGLFYRAIEPQPGVYDDAYIAKIAQTVDTLAAHGIYSLLDFHQDLYNERFSGLGLPAWATEDDGLPNQPDFGFPGNYLGMPALWRAFDHFWANDPAPDGIGLTDHYARAWAHVASRFASNPYVLGYDLFNEPWPGSQYPTCTNPAGCPVFDRILGAAQTRMIDAIRSVDPGHIVFYEPNVIFNDGAMTQLPDFGDKHAAMSFHNYCLPASVGGAAGVTDQPQGCGAEEGLVFGNADARSTATGDGLLMTEWGATSDLGVIRRVADEADQHELSWQEWAYNEGLVYDQNKAPEGTNVNAPRLAALVRPYPLRVAGTPTSYRFDTSTREFTLTYSTGTPTGRKLARTTRTEIAVPALVYPKGYSVSVSGGRVVSEPDADPLVVERGRDAASVSVTVRPRA